MRPFYLPHCEIRISVKAEKNAGCSLRIADDKTREQLAIRSAVTRAAGLHGSFVKTRRLKEYSLLGLPKKRQESDQQREYNEGGNHTRTLRGFQ
jgi:hypothetical protein